MKTLKVYSPNGCKPFMQATPDGVGHVFGYNGMLNHMTPGSALDYKACDWILRDLSSRFPLGWMEKMPIFILPGQLHVFDSRWTGLRYNAQAFATHIAVGAWVDSPLVCTLTHEIGHALTYLFIDPVYEDKNYTQLMSEYMNVRGLDPAKFGYGRIWEDRVWEVFAEDFRWLFGCDHAKTERFLPYEDGDPQPPNDRTKEWMLWLVKGVGSQVQIQFEEGVTDKMHNHIKIADNFELYEFESKDTGEAIVHPKLLAATQATRTELRVAVVITSGYRTPEHNVAVGGKPDSYHRRGEAIDGYARDKSLELFAATMKKHGATCVRIYPDKGFVHCDLGPQRAW